MITKEQDKEILDRIYKEGAKAYTDGISFFNNPYFDEFELDGAHIEAWANGWGEAQASSIMGVTIDFQALAESIMDY
jgi:hypothetical protein